VNALAVLRLPSEMPQDAALLRHSRLPSEVSQAVGPDGGRGRTVGHKEELHLGGQAASTGLVTGGVVYQCDILLTGLVTGASHGRQATGGIHGTGEARIATGIHVNSLRIIIMCFRL
jgi:hypothetical protein